MKKILFPTDFSTVSKNAFVYALKLADAVGAEIITLHVCELDLPIYLDVSIYQEDIYQYDELSDFENYKDELPVLRKIADDYHLEHIKISNVLVQGHLVDEVVKLAQKEEIDIIVLGIKEVSYLGDVFFSNVVAKIMDECKAIVLAIPEKCKYEPIKNILFSTRFNMSDIDSLKEIMNFSDIFHGHVDCLNIKPPHTVYKDDFVVDFKNIFKGLDISFHSVLSTDFEKAILNFIEKNNINLVAIHERHRGFFEKLFQINLPKKLPIYKGIPILSVH